MKSLRILVCLALAAALFVGMQTAAFAAVSLRDDTSSHVSSHVSSQVSSHVSSNMIQPYANNSLSGEAREGTVSEGTLYSSNNVVPRTGMGSLAVPGLAALLAAATAAVALTGKKK